MADRNKVAERQRIGSALQIAYATRLYDAEELTLHELLMQKRANTLTIEALWMGMGAIDQLRRLLDGLDSDIRAGIAASRKDHQT